MEIDIAGPTYNLDTKQYDAQRCVNLFPFPSETATSKAALALRGTPGLESFNSDVNGPMRGCIVTGNGRCFFVGNDKLYEIDSNGVQTERGTLNTQVGRVSLADGGVQLMLVDGTNGYTLTLSSNSFAQISDGDFPNGATHVIFFDQYFIVNKPGTGAFYISSLLDGTAWDALDFANAESMPDDLVALVKNGSELWLVGSSTIEVYYNSGDADFPFERVSGGVIQSGCAAGFTAVEFADGIIWLEEDDKGRGRIMRANGYNAQRISTKAIEEKISGLNAAVSNSYCWTYHADGHEFAVFQIDGLDTTFVFDALTGLWHERQHHQQADNLDKQHLGSCACYFANAVLVGDRLTGNIYKMKQNVYTDNGDAIHRERITPPLSVESDYISISELELDMETGVGLDVDENTSGYNPKLMISASKDGGKEYGNERFLSMGKQGEYTKRVRSSMWGAAREWVFKLRVTDPVEVMFLGKMFIK